MSAKSKKSSKKKVDRPFDQDVLHRAAQLVDRYQVVIEFEDGQWIGHGLEMPGVMADGTIPGECVEQVREAMVGAVAMMLEQGQSPPAAAREGKRTEQVNIRISAEEKIRLQRAAQQLGFRGIGDYLRQTALDRAG